MASVTSTQVVSDIAEADGQRYVRYRYDLLDNLGGNYIEYIIRLIASDADAEADMISLIPNVLNNRKITEQQDWLSLCTEGQDPLHWDNGGFWDKTTPLWGTWEEIFDFVGKWFFSRENQLELAPYNVSWGRVSTTDKRNGLGITNPNVTTLNSSMQIAVDTKAALDTYIPFFDQNGNPQ